jgi:hypothetical protein
MNSLREGNLISFQSLINTEDNDEIEIYIAEIKKTTDKAILVEWDDSNWAYWRKCQTWIPLSILIVMDSEIINWNKRRHKLFYVALPVWAKIFKEVISERNPHFPDSYYGDFISEDDTIKNYSYSNHSYSVEDAMIDEERQWAEDNHVQELIELYNKEQKPWVDLWDGSLTCRRCYRKVKVECDKSDCINHPNNPKQKTKFSIKGLRTRK